MFRNNYTSQRHRYNHGNQWNTRWDYYRNEKNSLFGRYKFMRVSRRTLHPRLGLTPAARAFRIRVRRALRRAQTRALPTGWTRTSSPTLINEFRFGYMRYHVVVTPGGIGDKSGQPQPASRPEPGRFYTPACRILYIKEAGDSDQGGNGGTQLGYALNNNRCNCPLNRIRTPVSVR